MKTWKTAVVAVKCGYDWAHVVAAGEAYLEIEDGAGKKRVRCSKCAVRHETHVIEEPVADAQSDAVGPGDERVDDWGGADGEDTAADEPQAELETEQDPW